MSATTLIAQDNINTENKIAEDAYQKAEKHLQGIGVAKDEKLAFENYKVAAEKGHQKAIYKLAYCYIDAVGTVQDERSGFETLTKGIAVGKPEAEILHALAYCYDKGIGTPQDNAAAKKYYLLAAKKQYAPALYNIGVCYEYDLLGFGKDTETAIKYYKEAADLGFSMAKFALGRVLQDKRETQGESFKYLSSIVNELPDPSIKYYLGNCYALSGNMYDSEKATEYFKMASEQGYQKANHDLGIYYMGKDWSRAIRCFEQAEEVEPSSAMALGDIYSGGWGGTSQDIGKAILYYKSAADRGVEIAKSKFETWSKIKNSK